MEQSELDKKIKERALQRFNDERKDLLNLIYTTDILSRMKVRSEGILYDFKYLFEVAYLDELTNFSQVRTELLEWYEKQEVKRIFDQLDSLETYLGKGGEND